jgi:hypothetical protein
MDEYSPLWQFNSVIVPRDCEPNTLRSAADCLSSGFGGPREILVSRDDLDLARELVEVEPPQQG